MPITRALRFGRYRLHPTQGLMRGRQEIRITPKSLAVLCALVDRAGDVVTKDELFRLVWTDTAVSDAALTSCIVELRQALDDDARRPRYIETLHRRGFRFLMQAASEGPDPTRPDGEVQRADPIVGRDAAIQQVFDAVARARAGTRQVVLVTGEPGIGKTALVQTCLCGLPDSEPLRIARAECVEHYGAGEAYQPLLEALTRLCRQPDGDRVVTALRRTAPTWLAQLPAVQTPAELAVLRRRAAGVTPDRMLRELTDALEALAAEAPIVLCVEDLHWSDASTLDWIGSFARRPEQARVLLIGTYRPGEAARAGRSAESLAHDLSIKGCCTEIALAGLDPDAVIAYAVRRFPPIPDARGALERVARLLYEHTEGNPLFLVNVLADLVARGILVAHDDRWDVRDTLDAASLGIPVDLRRTIERQIDRLGQDERRLLEVAGIFGTTAVAASVAAGLDAAVSDVEEALSDLARRNAFVRTSHGVEWPDGTVSASVEFQHALYAEVLSGRLSPARRAEVHRKTAARLEAAYGDRAPDIAAELAVHFDAARDVPRAVVYFQHAAEMDRRRSAHDDALPHYRRALALLERLPPSADRDAREAALQIGLGSVLMQIDGWGTPAVEAAYARARELCEGSEATPQLFSSMWNLWIFYTARGRLDAARQMVDRLFAFAHAADDEALLLQAHHAQWSTLFDLGDLRGTEAHAREGLRLAASQAERRFAYGSHDAHACARAFAARALALLGRSDAAVGLCEEGVRLARELDHPFTLSFMLMHAAAVHETRRDVVAARECAAAAREIAADQSFDLMDAWASCYLGWALAALGDSHAGLSALETGVARARAGGAEIFAPHLLGLLASARIGAGLWEDARRSLEEAFIVSERTGERFFSAELYRLRAELRLASGDEGQTEAHEQAEQDLRTALSVARGQGALQLALRTAISLARLWIGMGRGAEAEDLLREARSAISEGADLPDVVEAAALLAGQKPRRRTSAT